MTRCSLKVLEPEELMNQELDVDNLYVRRTRCRVMNLAEILQGFVPDHESMSARVVYAMRC